MTSHIKITPTQGTWVARADGAIIAETNNAQMLAEGKMPAVVYFPRADIRKGAFEPSSKTSYCPYKGQASYFSIKAARGTLKDAAWSYEAPKDGVEGIKDHVAFYPDVVAVEKL